MTRCRGSGSTAKHRYNRQAAEAEQEKTGIARPLTLSAHNLVESSLEGLERMMRPQFHNRHAVLLALAVGGIIALAKDFVAGVSLLHSFALTPKGLATVVVATFLVSVASLFVTFLRR